MGGKDAQEGQWPWQVSLRNNGLHFCGGTLISQKWVLSAAHCFISSVKASSITVFLGSYKLFQPDSNEVAVAVNRIIQNPSYAGERGSGDISLLELAKEVSYTDFIQPICLPDSTVTFPTGQQCWVTGWGNIAYGSSQPSPRTLQGVAVPVIGSSQCKGYYQTPTSSGTSTLQINSDMICAGYINGGKDSCQGDSGGPLVCAVNNQWFLAGVVSFGDGCGEPYRPGVYTLVTYYKNWIQSNDPDVSVNVRDVIFTGPFVSLYNMASPMYVSTLQLTWILLLLNFL
ncbi:hypothetical protein GDO86_019693 [Hymenochirus boettgeri]|uniref:Peptidase S1 domain-containing protein n=1 Tax=Hymenochirus boettgeri TaxID=247094 RepID=A0A8T2ICB8_9PIPI|nr:hypothetical protein GDO86_019693 [Hymenochirus boettgeri]